MSEVVPLYVDGAVGSNELIEPLQALGLPAEKAKLAYGDICFVGRGEGGTALLVGIELKRIGELATSLRTKRFQGHQLLGLTRDYDRRYLLVEGDYHQDAEGRGVVYDNRRGRTGPLHSVSNVVAFEQELINIQTRGGCWIRHTTTRRDTLRFIQACYRYWTEKSLDEHRSHLAMYAPDLDRGLLTPPSDFRKALTVMLPGIGFAVSKAVEDYVGAEERLRVQLMRMLGMAEGHWAGLETADRNGKTKKLGASKARQIMETLG